VDVDESGTMYVAASTGLLQAGVFTIGPSGAPVTLIIPSTAATPNMVGADSVARDGDGNLYVAAMGTDSVDRVYRFDPSGAQTLALDIGGRIGAVDVDASGSFWITAQDAKTINRYDPDGTLTLTLPTDLADPPMENPIGINVSPDGRTVYVADNQAAHVYRFELDNTTLTPGITAVPDLIATGATSTVTVTVVDDGGCDASDVTVTAALPAGLELVTAAPADGTTYDPTTGVWSVGDLQRDGGASTLALTVRGVTPGVYQLDATANAVASDVAPETASTTLTVLAPIEPTFTG
jgi:sugar lactone lactonase YvrE